MYTLFSYGKFSVSFRFPLMLLPQSWRRVLQTFILRFKGKVQKSFAEYLKVLHKPPSMTFSPDQTFFA